MFDLDELDEEEGARGDEMFMGPIKERCDRDLARAALEWTPVTMDTVRDNHTKVAKGMIYGLEFPWTDSMVRTYGAKWLTDAFHAAGTLPAENEVEEIVDIKAWEGGSNGLKLKIVVKYRRLRDGLHTTLFGKIPYPMDAKFSSDRLNGSVYKQPQDLSEINLYRLLEGSLPFKIPRYYFGDVSNVSTNFILLTEWIDYADPDGARPGNLGPMEVEGPYEKFMDWTLRGEPREYHYLLMRVLARMCGHHKSGKLAPVEVVDKHFENWGGRSAASWGVRPESSGMPEAQLRMKLSSLETFVTDTARVIYPDEIADPAFLSTVKIALATIDAYSLEIMYWLNRNPDYCALTHQNMNVDNAYFWRTESGELDCGLLDWGGTRTSSLAFKMWYALYCLEFDFMKEHMNGLLRCFIDSYHETGGPRIELEEFRAHFLLTMARQLLDLTGAIPLVHKMLPKSNWATITTDRDPRCCNNVDGKNTLRLYVRGILLNMRMIKEFEVEKVVEKFVVDYTAHSGVPRKSVPAF